MFARLNFVFLIASLATSGCAQAPAATGIYTTQSIHATPQVYAAIPETDRQDFRTAMEGLVALEKSGNWGEVYERFYLNDRGMTKAQFTKKRGALRVVAFIPQQIYYVPPAAAWMVSGCAVFSPPLPLLDHHSGGFVSSFTAKHTANGWRFDAPPAISIFEDRPGTRSCSVTN
jgi:hypothetical protein